MVDSPKTGPRVIPLFDELLPILEDARELAKEGDEYVITRYRKGTQNLGTQLRRIVNKAKLTPWPRLWQNLRASRQTELTKLYPMRVVCKWLGNSPRIANEHYLGVTEADYESAINREIHSDAYPEMAPRMAPHMDTTEPTSTHGESDELSNVPVCAEVGSHVDVTSRPGRT